MIKNKKQMFIIIGVFAVLLMLTTVTYAFFNYTRTGVANTIRVGRISFITRQNGNINLTNVFPISSSEATGENANYDEVEIEIEGDTDYTGGIEYVVTATNVNLTVGNKEVPISLEIDVDGLGTEDADYYTNRENYSTNKYKVEYNGSMEDDTHILVGYIAPNTSGNIDGIDGTINIKSYLDKDRIAITDTYDGNETDNMGTTNEWVDNRVVLTANEWNSLQSNGLSFKIKVEANEGIWVENPMILRSVIVRKTPTVNYIASYDDLIASDPSYSTYTTQDQVLDSATKQTVYYFTGNDAAANANVLFAGYCWQIVRTTDDGGVRLIYNGVAENNKCETTRTATKGIKGTNGTSTSLASANLFGRNYDYDLNTGEFTIKDSIGLPSSWTTSDNNSNGIEDYKELIGTYTCLSNLDTCTTLYYVGSISQNNPVFAYTSRYTIDDVAHYSQLGTSAFNTDYYSPALVGYMFNEVYDYHGVSKSGEYYANATYENGAYILSNGNGRTEPDVTHHYICDSDCTKVRYYYYSTNYYILLENGTTIEDALYKMIGYGDTTILSKPNNANYVLNNYNSAIKGYLDNWYRKNLTDYTGFLDQSSVYCNDRSIIYIAGWNPSGADIYGYLKFYQFSSGNRDLNCVNETDRFAMTNNKAKLSYPIGLLTEPERYLMTANYAATGQYYWGTSPSYFNYYTAYVRFVASTGDYSYNGANNSYGVRAVVTLRPGTELNGGTGTYDNPYVIGPIVQRDN